MKTKEFIGKLFGAYLWANLLAMVLVVALIGWGVKIGLERYTHHGEAVEVPQLVQMRAGDARQLTAELGLEMMVSDSGYNKRLPADCVLGQSPAAGMKVKRGRVVYVTVNLAHSPAVTIPDLIDNSSYREAEAKLQALGFRLMPAKLVLGEKDWVYGIQCRGRQLNAGDRVSTELPLTIVIGNGMYGDDEDIEYTEPEPRPEDTETDGAVDPFTEMNPDTLTIHDY